MPWATIALAAAVPLVLGVLVLLRRGPRWAGGLLVTHAVSVGLVLTQAQPTTESWSPAWVDQLAQGSWVLLFLWLVLLGYLLPDGRPASPRWRLWIWLGPIGAALFMVGAAGDRSGFAERHDGRELPLAWLPSDVSSVLGLVGLVVVVLFIFGSAVAVRSRFQSATGEARLQLLWLLWGSLSVPVALLVLWGNEFVFGAQEWLANLAIVFASSALPAAITIAILRHRLFDIRILLSSSLVYTLLTGAVLGTYALALLLTDRLLGEREAGGVIAVLAVAVGAQPALNFLRRHIDFWVYGYRSAPHEAIRLLAERADAASDEGLLVGITEAVAKALRAEGVWMGAAEDQFTDEPVMRAPLVDRGASLGELVVQLPAGRDPSPADEALLRDLARYAAVLVHADRLNADLRESRSRIVTGRDEERRRLRRELHDGLGPTLAAMVLQLNAAQARTEESERNALLAETRQEVKGAIAEIRRLVDDLRPPALDELGLVGAIRQRAASLSSPLLAIDVDGPESPLSLPAAVEVAAFRIASEAMTNAVRHSGGSRCRVTIELGLGGRLALTVTDNGGGSGIRLAGGVGWTSMRERAAEVSGSLSISSPTGGGLVVLAVLPGSAIHEVTQEVG